MIVYRSIISYDFGKRGNLSFYSVQGRFEVGHSLILSFVWYMHVNYLIVLFAYMRKENDGVQLTDNPSWFNYMQWIYYLNKVVVIIHCGCDYDCICAYACGLGITFWHIMGLSVTLWDIIRLGVMFWHIITPGVMFLTHYWIGCHISTYYLFGVGPLVGLCFDLDKYEIAMWRTNCEYYALFSICMIYCVLIAWYIFYLLE